MNDDTKQMGIGMLAIMVLAGMAIFGSLRCEVQKQDTLRQCLQTSRPALECSAMVNGGSR